MTEIVDMQGSSWVRFHSDGWKVHFCPKELLPGLMEDSASRDHAYGDVVPVSEGFIDLPGMIMADRTYQELTLDGFKLSIPTEDFESFYEELKRNSVRMFSDGRKYYKIHGWLHCVVFTPEQRELVLGKMEMLLPAVVKKAKEERAEFNRRIAEINRDGVKVISAKAPDSIPKIPVSGKPNDQKN